MQQKEEEMRQAGLKLQTALAEAELYKAQVAVAKQRMEQMSVLIDTSKLSVEQQQAWEELRIKERDSVVDAAVKVAELGLEAEKVAQTADQLQ